MTPAFDEGQVRAWLSTLYADACGFINIVSTNNWAGRSYTDLDQAVSYVRHLDSLGVKGIYARATTLKSKLPSDERGGVDHTSEFVGFWADMDVQGPGHKTTKPLPAGFGDVTRIIVEAGLPVPTEWISSGGGFYPWWMLHQPALLADDAAIADLADLSAKLQRVIELASEKLGFSYGAGVGDLSRVLRIPGTVNRKVPDVPTMCEWMTDATTSQPYTLEYLRIIIEASLDRLEPPKKAAPALTHTPPSVGLYSQGGRPGDAFNAATTWQQLLEADGAQIDRDRGGYIEWVRPGKDRRDGMSATTGYMGSDVLKVFTDSWPNLRQGETYDRFGYWAATRHNGNIKEATKDLAARGYGEKRLMQPDRNHWSAWDEKPSPFIYEATPSEVAAAFTDEDKPTPEQLEARVTAAVDRLEAVRPMARRQTYTFTDSGVADRMQARHGEDWRFVASRQKFGWLRWNGKIWDVDKRGQVTNLIDQLVQEAYDDTRNTEDEKERKAQQAAIKPMLSNSKQLGATAVFARRPQVAVDSDELDAVKNKVTCDNGVLDLSSMTFGPHDRGLLATKKLGVAYDPAAKAPKWEKFLSEVLPDAGMRDYLQRAIGYTLLGEPVRKAIFMLHGPSHTGKSQVVNALSAIFGTFSEGAKEQTFRVNDAANGPTPGLHKLRGARLVTASESTEGVKLDEALIKQLTGGDAINSRPLYGDEETWTPEFSIWLATNHLPKFNSDDNAIWRRVKPIHFGVVFGQEGRDEVMDIGRRLVAEEGPGILNWILDGVANYRERGLTEPATLTEGVTAYQNESDPVARFIQEAAAQDSIVLDAEEKIEARQLYTAFASWCADEGIRYPLAAARFGRRMSTLGYTPTRTSTARFWKGIGAGKNTFIVSGQQVTPRWHE